MSEFGPVDREFVQSLPKCELHLHLEGSLRPDTMRRLAARNGVDLEDDLERRYTYDGFDHFLELFLMGLRVLRTGEDFADAVEALAGELAAQNVRYAEVTTTAFSHNRRQVAMADYAAGLNAGRAAARQKHGVELGWVIDIPREIEPPESPFTTDFVTGPLAPEGLVGIGLGGPEPGNPPEPYEQAFARVRAAGLRSLPHAGETEGPASVRGALEALGAERIGHGVRSVEDPALVDELGTRGTHLEVSLTSNVALQVVSEIDEHPLPALLEAGLSVGLNTDDPAYFSTTLNDELLLAATSFGLSRADLVALQAAAFRASSLPQDRTAEFLADLSRVST
ncbi:MAG: adenosine deaminase [Thermoleophilia bacterium]|nr:adenosine deaminase [Thermoleophilia bacterium]MDH3725588.1 adenosine deaminase [Thermoleophilia bacterium]